jgi:hypothetical protein
MSALVLSMGIGIVYVYLTAGGGDGSRREDITQQFFMNHMLAVGEVNKIEIDGEGELVKVWLHEGAVIDGKVMAGGVTYFFTIGSVTSFERALEAAQLQQLAEEDPERVIVTYRIPPTG